MRTLSKRMRHGREAAEWCIQEVEKLEDKIDQLDTDILCADEDYLRYKEMAQNFQELLIEKAIELGNRQETINEQAAELARLRAPMAKCDLVENEVTGLHNEADLRRIAELEDELESALKREQG